VIVNEVLQWIVLVVLTLLTLGVLRQVSLLLPPSDRGAASGPATGRRAPAQLLRRLEAAVGNGGLERGALVAFVTEDCVGCQRLLADVTEGRQQLDGQPLVLVAHRPSEEFAAALEESRIPLITDDGELWQDCRIASTPLVVRIDEKGRIAMKEVTHHVDRMALVHS
jgi:hypothetical protein